MPTPSSLKDDDPAEIGGFRLIGRLGSGGQGTVYLAEPEQGGSHVAVKCLNSETLIDPRVRQRFVREAEAARQVASFCTAAVLAADFEAESPYIVSEYVEGRSLSQRIRQDGPMSGGDLGRLAVATATALVAIHEAGIVHRDFKPGNVLLGDGGARVIDFGIAQITEGTGTLTNSPIGTPAFMAPEQISSGQPTTASDVFAWGVVLVYAATGASPFNADTLPNVLHNVLNVEPDLGAVPDGVRPLVERALNKNPAARPSAVDVLMTLLGRQESATGPDSLDQAMNEAHTAVFGRGAPSVTSPVTEQPTTSPISAAPGVSPAAGQPTTGQPTAAPPTAGQPTMGQQPTAGPTTTGQPTTWNAPYGTPPAGMPPNTWNPPYAGPSDQPARKSKNRLTPWLIGIGTVLVAGALVVAAVAGALLDNLLVPLEGGGSSSESGAGSQADSGGEGSGAEGGGEGAESDNDGEAAKSETGEEGAASGSGGGSGGEGAGAESGGSDGAGDSAGGGGAPAATSTNIYDIQKGDCFNDPASDSTSELQVVDCAVPHEAEVYGFAQLDGDREWPGAAALEAEAQTACEGEVFSSYVGIDYYSSKYHLMYYTPTESGWQDGDYEVICAAYEPEAEITGSVAGAGE